MDFAFLLQMQLEDILAHPDAANLARLLVALVLSGMVGWERESAGRAAGLRTHMLVGIGAASYVILGEVMARDFNTYGVSLMIDPLRIIQAVVIGIGFIGAGTIFVLRRNQRVVGLTTAASVWATAGIGMLAGLGNFLVATFIAVLIVGVLRLPEVLPGPESKDDEGGK